MTCFVSSPLPDRPLKHKPARMRRTRKVPALAEDGCTLYDMTPDVAAQWKLLQAIKQQNQHLRWLLEANDTPVNLHQDKVVADTVEFQYPINTTVEPNEAMATVQILTWYLEQPDSSL